FHEHAKRAIEEAEEADTAARGASASLSGGLRVSAAVTFARLHFVPNLGIFLTEHPELRIDVVPDDQNMAVAAGVPQANTIVMKNFDFSPMSLRIKAGSGRISTASRAR